MTTQLVPYTADTSLQEQIDYAQAVAPGSLLPQPYRDNPANVLIAIGLGSAMGLSRAESLYRIDVIQGKPCASAELIATNVRNSGHKLRVRVTENPPAASCTIIRSDDPEEPVTVERDMAWAQRMGLATKDNYKKQPATMLSWRAISACARLACPEALYGVAYTPDEIGDMGEPATITAVVEPISGADRMRAMLADIEPETTTTEPADVGDAPEAITDGQITMLHILLKECYLGDRDAGLAWLSDETGREIATSKTLTKTEASECIEALQRLKAMLDMSEVKMDEQA